MYIWGNGTNSELSRVATYYFKNVGTSSRSNTPLNSKIAYVVDDSYASAPNVIKYSQFSWNSHEHFREIFLPIGYKNLNCHRERVFHQFEDKGYKILSHIACNSFIHKDVQLGKGNWIQENVAIQTGSKVGNSNIFWGGLGVHVGHLSEIGDFNWISTGTVIAGGVKIGNNCFFGINSSVRNNIEIADGNILCMGAMVTKSTLPNQVWLPGLNNLSSKDSWEFKIDG